MPKWFSILCVLHQRNCLSWTFHEFGLGLRISHCLLSSYRGHNHDVNMANPSALAGCDESLVNTDTLSENKETKKTPFGTRYLSNPEKVFEHNAWDNMIWTEEQITDAKKKIEENSENLVEDDKQDLYENEADRFWDDFYSKHQNRFFKDRNWLFKEFPELSTQDAAVVGQNELHGDGARGESTSSEEVQREQSNEGITESSGTEMKGISSQFTSSQFTSPHTVDKLFTGSHCNKRYLEVGCGVGNTVFPILQTNNDPDLFVYCCDFSPVAIDLVKSNPSYDPTRCYGFVFDITDSEAELPFPEGSLDIIILIFVLSAVHPEKMQCAITRLASFLKPGGMILLRDYGKYDLAQLRFKPGRCLSDNFYVRGDGTRVYFFTQEELRNMFTRAGLKEEQNLIDRRLQVNRGRQITMYRVWIQCKYRKPDLPGT